jgi:hypothetical protein
MSYPTKEQLLRFGSCVKDKIPDQDNIDAIIEKECFFPTRIIHFNDKRFFGPHEKWLIL